MLDPNKVYVITDAKDIHEMRFLGDCDWHDEVVLSLPFQNITGDCMIIPKNSTWNVNGINVFEAIEKATPKRIKRWANGTYHCPNEDCEATVLMCDNYCVTCGQKLVDILK